MMVRLNISMLKRRSNSQKSCRWKAHREAHFSSQIGWRSKTLFTLRNWFLWYLLNYPRTNWLAKCVFHGANFHHSMRLQCCHDFRITQILKVNCQSECWKKINTPVLWATNSSRWDWRKLVVKGLQRFRSSQNSDVHPLKLKEPSVVQINRGRRTKNKRKRFPKKLDFKFSKQSGKCWGKERR